MKQCLFDVVSNEAIARNTFRMTLCGDTSAIERPGQFVDLKLDGFFLRRPISVCDVEGGLLTLIYKTVGRGTGAMADLRPGTRLDLLTGLGNGYCEERAGMRPLLIGGGAGVPPLLWLGKRLKAKGASPVAVLGFNCADEVFGPEMFRSAGVPVILCTADGSLGIKGFVTDGMRTAGPVSYTYACGPLPMLRAVYDMNAADGEFSFEERMGCGFGACMGCSHATAHGYKRLCREGPVLRREEILW